MSYSNFIFVTLPKNYDNFQLFFKNQLKISNTKSTYIFNFISSTQQELTLEIFNNSVIGGIGSITKNKVINFECNFFQIKSPETPIKPIDVIILAIVSIDKPQKHLKDIYIAVSKQVGGSNINLKTMLEYKNKDGTVLDYPVAKKRQEGFIRTTLEENSSDSRQYYVRANHLYKDGLPSSKNLFSNQSARLRNELNDWKMYVPGNCYKKSSGIWEFSPGLGKPTLPELINMESELINKPKGFRGQANCFTEPRFNLSRMFTSVKC